ncbi:hypothetical protein N7532_012139 [Penicillium argentinense]|uniref:Uncharacterized protein n=1 Tax=Penicillium argentinense TaxID=1131581 RepID=A0A9W9EK07_9EURO|nr:uncharacterized protein N7532_012139 [Penicillium argentinense]KAJ5083096.1 hypothetical protein N7532_012139 [Penicillium argentinense]
MRGRLGEEGKAGSGNVEFVRAWLDAWLLCGWVLALLAVNSGEVRMLRFFARSTQHPPERPRAPKRHRVHSSASGAWRLLFFLLAATLKIGEGLSLAVLLAEPRRMVTRDRVPLIMEMHVFECHVESKVLSAVDSRNPSLAPLSAGYPMLVEIT